MVLGSEFLMSNPYFRFAFLSLGGAVLLASTAYFLFENAILAWLIGADLAALITFRYDKSVAGTRRMRVPEAILLLLEAIGGTVGAAFAIWIWQPRHKTQSGKFLFWFFGILAIQIALLIFYRDY